MIPITLFMFPWDQISQDKKTKWPSTEGRTFTATTQGISGLLKGLPNQQEPQGGWTKPHRDRLPEGCWRRHFQCAGTPELPLGPYGVKAVWPGPKLCQYALFQQSESTDSSPRSWKGGHPYDPSFLNPLCSFPQCLSAPLHLPLPLLPPPNPAVFHPEKKIQTKNPTSHTQNRMYRKVKHFWFPSQGIRSRAVPLTLHQKLILPPPPHRQASSPDSSSLHKAHA